MKKFKTLSLILFTLSFSTLAKEDASKLITQVDNQTSHLNIEISDGPYVFKNKSKSSFTSFWVCDGERKQEITLIDNYPHKFNSCGLSAEVTSGLVKEDNILEYSGDFKIAATSDFHGQYKLMMQLLQNNNIIDTQGNWSFDNGHLVITGDVFDRGDQVTEILWFLYKLEKQALRVGGQVHLLLGNHEVMTLNGDLRYLNPKYEYTANTLNIPYDELFSKESILGNWIRSKPVLVKINNMLFTHGGFHPSLAKEKHTLSEINTVFKANLVKSELSTKREGWGKYLHKKNGPIWYRGYFKVKDEGASNEEIELLLHHFNVKNIIVGHTSQKQIETRHEGKVIAIDSSIKNGKYGEVLLIDGNNKWRGTLSGEMIPLENTP